MRPLPPSQTLVLLSSMLLAGCPRADQARGTRAPTAGTTGGDAADTRGTRVNLGSGAAAAARAASGTRP